MTALRMEVMNTLEQIPEDKLQAVLDMMKKLVDGDDEELKKSQEAFDHMMKIVNNHHIELPADFDYKEEIAKAVFEKYARIG